MWRPQGAGEDGWWWRLQKGLPLPPSPTRAPAPASPGGAGEQRRVGPRRGRQGERGSGGGRAGPRVGQPPPRSSSPRSYSERSLPAADSPIAPPPPLPASRRPGPAVTPGRGSSRPAPSHPAPSRPGPPGERRGRRNHAATGGLGSRGSCFFFKHGAGCTRERGSRSGRRPRGALTSLSGKPGRRPHLQRSCTGEREAKEEFRLDRPLLSRRRPACPPGAGWRPAGRTAAAPPSRPPLSPSGRAAGPGRAAASADLH